MTKRNQPVEESKRANPRASRSGADQHLSPYANRLKRSLPRESVEKAETVFENFSLSKFPKDSLPSNYVHPYKKEASLPYAERTRHVQDFQKKKIDHHIQKLKTVEQHAQKAGARANVVGITVALPKDKVHKILPSYKKDDATAELSELMGLVEKHTRGAEFYTNGDPTLKRIAFLGRVNEMRKKLALDTQVKKGAAQ